MVFLFTPYVFASIFTTILALIVLLLAVPRRAQPGARSLIAFVCGAMLWSAATAIEFGVTSIPGKVFWSKVEYLGALTTPVFFLLLALEHNRMESWFNRRNFVLLFAVPVFTMLLAWTNELHHLIWTSFTPTLAGSNLIIYGHGVWYWIGVVAYSYSMMLAATGLLIRAAIVFPAVYRIQTVLIIVASLAPWLGNLAYNLGFSLVPGYEPTSFLITFSGLMLVLDMLFFRLLDLVPVALQKVVESMGDAMFVLDRRDRLVYLNPAALKFLDAQRKDLIGNPASQVFAGLKPLLDLLGESVQIHSEFSQPAVSGNELHHYDVNISSLSDLSIPVVGSVVTPRPAHRQKHAQREFLDDWRDKVSGRLIVMRDTTELFSRETALKEANLQLEQLNTRLRQQNDSMSVLYDCALDFLQKHDMASLLNSIAIQANRLLKVEIVEILTLEDDYLIPQLSYPETFSEIGSRYDRSQARFSWQAVDTLQPVIVDEYWNQEHQQQKNYKHPIHAAASFPIIINHQCMGVLDLGRESHGLPFTPDDIQLAKLFTQIAALAIENARLHTSLLVQSIRDPLTGLYNRRYMFETLQKDLARSVRDNTVISFVLLDIDNFKRINDGYGHGAGDEALKALANLLQKMVRAGDILCRYGGDEHLIIMHNAPAHIAIERAEQWRVAVETMQVEYEKMTIHLTISLGVSTCPDHGNQMDELISCADKALYTSKNAGRNRTSFYQSA